jgi:enoyl-CoA hydratase/carnithine racemase
MIKTQARERIATIELARPEKKNALTAAMYAAMTESLATESDPGVR